MPTSASRGPGRRCAHLNAVVNSPELREAYNATLPKVTQFFTEQGQDQRLLRGLQGARRLAAASTRGARARRRHVENELRDFRLGGAELPPPQKARFLADPGGAREAGLALPGQRARRDQRFRPLRDRRARSSPAFPRTCSRPRREAAKKEGRAGWKLTLHMPCYHAGDAVRRPRWPARAPVSRLRDARLARFGDKPDWNNTANIVRILELRAEAAALLGYAHLRRGLARHQDGGHPAPRRSRSSTTSPRRAKPFAERDMAGAARIRPRASSTWPTCAPGT